ncbi:DUF3844 family transmembrane protein, conserved protein [Schizosaccharomyces osmophilus]|uniref:DUF3844 family transmembrane protein, conserved protein n=1 Tax=Schizosaccharomyces osmophilus TaxID=2545709 RepID=A0AAE9W829_9SCHI|nr:DUF3844 family transmembrane protein, conserved protein [Schizosaccharomyces osmophilus]WBW71459.1 DUF3844 family transmembrane protein, conserved protein [Schizosaccharomyces osmophilus]
MEIRMRFSKFLFSLLLGIIVACVSGSLHSNAVVYISSFDEASNYVPSLNPSEARLIFAHMLGISQFHKLEGNPKADKLLQELLQQENSLSSFFDFNYKTFLTVSGLNLEEPVKEINPTFFIKDTPSSNSFGALIRRFQKQLNAADGKEHRTFYTNDLGGSLSVHALFQLHPIKQDDLLLLHLYERLFGKVTATFFDINKKQDQIFLSEVAALYEYIEYLKMKSDSGNVADPSIGFGQIVSLEIMYHTDGATSEKYRIAQDNIISLLLQLKQYSSTNYVLLPPSDLKARSARYQKRQLDLEAFGEEIDRVVASNDRNANGSCFMTEEACKKTTNSCSGRGECVKYANKDSCFVCQCASTVITAGNGGNRTIQWAGETCGKQDISIEFQFFFWFAIIGFGLLVFCIKLLFSVGQEELANVLTSTTPITKKNI